MGKKQKIVVLGLFAVMAVFMVIFVKDRYAYDAMLKTLYSNTVPTINSQELVALMEATGDKLHILDIRSAEEYRVSHLSEARLVAFEGFHPTALKDIDKKAKVVLYCSVGFRSEKIGEQLLAEGYTDVTNLYGGIFKWVNDGHVVTNHIGEPTDSVHTFNKEWSIWLRQGVKVYD